MKKLWLFFLLILFLPFVSAVTLDNITLNTSARPLGIEVKVPIEMDNLTITSSHIFFVNTYLDYWVYRPITDSYIENPTDQKENKTFTTGSLPLYLEILRFGKEYQFVLLASFLGAGIWFTLWGMKLDQEHLALKIMFTVFALVVFLAGVFVIDHMIALSLGGYYAGLMYAFMAVVFILFILFIRRIFLKVLT